MTAPIACPDCGQPITRQCTGHITQARGGREAGHRCHHPAVRGALVCGSHGGRAPQVRAAAERRLAEDAAERACSELGVAVAGSPADALIEALAHARGRVIRLRVMEAALGDEFVWSTDKRVIKTGQPTTQQRGGQQGQPTMEVTLASRVHPISRLLSDAEDRVSRIASEMSRLGIQERQTRVAEQNAAQLRQVLDLALAESGLAPQDQARVVEALPNVIRRLTVVPGAN